MFRQKKINEFIEKYGWELADNDFLELEEFLNKIPKFPLIIKKMNKLPKREQEYVIKTINDYKKYNFNPDQVELLLNDKLDIIKENKNNFKLLDFDRLYYAFNCNEKVYRAFISDYKNKKKELSTTITLSSYYEVISKYYRDFHRLFKDALTKKDSLYSFDDYIFSLSPRCLCSFFGFTKENRIPLSIQKRFFNIIATKNHYFENLSIREFNDILEFSFKCQDESDQKDVLDRKINMIMYFKDEIKNDWNYLNALSNLPDDYVIGIFKENNIAYDINFLNLLKERDNDTKTNIINFIYQVKSHYNDKYYKILNSDVFKKLNSQTIKLALDEISKLSSQDEDIRMEKINFIMSCVVLDDNNFILNSLKFIENDLDVKLISTKINCVKNIISHIYNNEISINSYNKYLEILNEGLDGKTIDEQVDILEAKMLYFEMMNSYKDIDKLDKRIFSLFVDEENRNNSVYSFINKTVNTYDNYITEKIIERLPILSQEDKEMYVDFIIDEFFTSSDRKRQELLLKLFDKNTVNIDFEENKDNLVEVSPYIHGIIKENDSPLEFVNKDTGLKIFVK